MSGFVTTSNLLEMQEGLGSLQTRFARGDDLTDEEGARVRHCTNFQNYQLLAEQRHVARAQNWASPEWRAALRARGDRERAIKPLSVQ